MKHYAIRVGRKNNVIVNTWDECEALVSEYPGAIYKSFKIWQLDEAKAFASAHGKTTNNPRKTHRPDPHFKSRKYAVPKPHQVCLVRGMFEGKRRCLVRYWATTVGENYEPNDSTEIPWK